MEDQLRKLVSHACRVLYAQGQDHFDMGHVSARAPGSERIWVKPAGLGLGEVRPDDVVFRDLNGNHESNGASFHREMPIHTEIYRRRPDVNCVVHTHPFHSVAYASAKADFQVVSQDSLPFADGVAYYPSAQLVTTTFQGASLAEALGMRNAIVLKNHGIAAVDNSVPGAVFFALSLERSLKLQHAAAQFGAVDAISDEEVKTMRAYFATSADGRIESIWHYLLRAAGIETRSTDVPNA